MTKESIIKGSEPKIYIKVNYKDKKNIKKGSEPRIYIKTDYKDEKT